MFMRKQAGGPPAVTLSRFALLCIDTQTKSIKRYWRNSYGKLWATHESVLVEVTDETPAALNEFRMHPEDFEVGK